MCEIFHSAFFLHQTFSLFFTSCVRKLFSLSVCFSNWMKTHSHTWNTKLNDTNSDSFHGQIECSFFCALFWKRKKNSFMIYDLLSIMRTLRLSARTYTCVCVYFKMFRFIAFFSDDIWTSFFVQFSRAMGHTNTHKIFNDR